MYTVDHDALKRDECTVDHDALKRDNRRWRSLLFIGLQWFEDEPVLELRNCHTCHSTLAIVFGSNAQCEDEE